MFAVESVLLLSLLFLNLDSGLCHPCPPFNVTTNRTSPCFPEYGDPRFPYVFPPPPHPQPYPNYPVGFQNPTYGFQPHSQVHWPQAPQPMAQRSGYTYPPNYSGPSQYYPRLPFYGYPLPHNSFQRRSGPLPVAVKASEPVFMGRGTVQIMNNRDSELTCSFTDPKYRIISVSCVIEICVSNLTLLIVQNIVWVKVTGPYDHFMPVPPFDCLTPGCQYEHINNAADFRFRVITLGPTSILRIYDFIHRDFGIYRCAATATGADGQTVTLYKIAEFLQPPPTTLHQGSYK